MLKVVYDSTDGVYKVVNQFDGVVVEEFLCEVDANDFAFDEEANERARVELEYQQV